MSHTSPFINKLLKPPIQEGVLSGCSFGVKDMIDVEGMVTGGGNPDWETSHSYPAPAHAMCVEQCLRAGAEFVGKTISDELAYSLDGENAFFGTPLNPVTPDRVPGGSSSGSVSAVARGLCDFALGTDTGGSIRVPASNCGVYGYRPTHGRISVSGVIPFAPTYDTVGVLASSASLLKSVGHVLLPQSPDDHQPENIFLLKDAFDLVDEEVKQALQTSLNQLAHVQEITVNDLVGEPSKLLEDWLHTFFLIQWEEIWCSLGGWIESDHPKFGPRTEKNFALTKNFDRGLLQAAIEKRERYCKRFDDCMGPRDLICLPATPAFAPMKGSLSNDRQTGSYYPRTLALTSIAGICRAPQVVVPAGSIPSAGISFLAKMDRDYLLLDFIRRLD